MSAENDSSVMLNSADAPQRPWQFSIRGLMGLMLVMSVGCAFVSWWGIDGVLWYLALFTLGLIVYGMKNQKNDYIIGGGLILSFFVFPYFIFVIGCWFVANGLRKRRKAYCCDLERIDVSDAS